MKRRLAKLWSFRPELTSNPASLAMCRIGVCLGLLISGLFRTDYVELVRASSALPYNPAGLVLYFFPSSPPGPSFITALRVVGFIATSLTLVGLFTRPMLVLTLVSSWFLAGLTYSFAPTTSAEYNSMLFVLLVLLVAPVDRALSLDAIRNRGKPQAPLSVAVCNVPVFAAQFMVAWLFFNAFCYKSIVSGSLWWRTDNLRNILSFQWLAAGKVMPPWVLFVADHVVLFRSFAVASMIAQGSMLLSLLFFRYPFRRGLFGLAYGVETLGLSLMMGLWIPWTFNPHWVVLYAVFVDWNSLLRGSPAPLFTTPSESPAASRWKRLGPVGTWALALVAFEFVASFATPGRNFNAIYPFGGFPMYSRLYGKFLIPGHSDFEFLGPHFVSRDVDLTLGSVGARIAYTNNFYVNEEVSIEAVRGRMLRAQRLLHDAHAAQTSLPPELTLFQTLYTVPAYPAGAEPSPTMEMIRGVVNHAGGFMGIATAASRGSDGTVVIDIRAKNVDLSRELSVWAIPIDYRGIKRLGRVISRSIYSVGAPVELHGEWTGTVFRTRELKRGAYLLAVRATPTQGFIAGTDPRLFLTGPIVEL